MPRRARALQGARARWCSSTDLPKTATGKLQRFKVRDLVADEPAAEPEPARAELEVTPVTPTEVDVLIVGAGPVGLYGAYYAGVRGLSVAAGRLARPRSAARSPRCTPRSRSTTSPASRPSPAATWCAELVAQADQTQPDLPARPGGPAARPPRRRPAARSPPATARGSTCGAVVVTGGIGTFTPRPLPAGEEFLGRGLEYFVPSSQEYVGRDVVIVGGGDSALDWALMLEPLASSVTLVHRREAFRAHSASVEQVRASGVRMIVNAQVTGARAAATWSRRPRSPSRGRTPAGRCPARRWSRRSGSPRTSARCANGAWTFTTTGTSWSTRPCAPTCPGVFAAGDITDYDGKVRLISVGFGEVATAVNNAAVHLDPDAQLFPGHSTDLPHDVPVPA